MSDKERTKGKWVNRDGDIYGLDGQRLIGWFDSLENEDEGKANAEFVCNVVNNHDSLVKACDEAMGFIEESRRVEYEDADYGKIIAELEQAIREARGEG